MITCETCHINATVLSGLWSTRSAPLPMMKDKGPTALPGEGRKKGERKKEKVKLAPMLGGDWLGVNLILPPDAIPAIFFFSGLAPISTLPYNPGYARLGNRPCHGRDNESM